MTILSPQHTKEHCCHSQLIYGFIQTQHEHKIHRSLSIFELFYTHCSHHGSFIPSRFQSGTMFQLHTVLLASHNTYKQSPSALEEIAIHASTQHIYLNISECSPQKKLKLNKSTKRNTWLSLRDTSPWWATNSEECDDVRHNRYFVFLNASHL